MKKPTATLLPTLVAGTLVVPEYDAKRWGRQAQVTRQRAAPPVASPVSRPRHVGAAPALSASGHWQAVKTQPAAGPASRQSAAGIRG